MYVKFKWDWFDNGEEYDTYIEIIDGYAKRQVMKYDNRYIGSNREDEEQEFFLTEGYIEIDEIEDVEIIDKKEFEEIWSKHCEKLLAIWLKTKEEFVKDMEVEEIFKMVYPQGVIVELSNGVIGIADYDECAKNSNHINLYPNHTVRAKVKDYDNLNMWLILKEARVF